MSAEQRGPAPFIDSNVILYLLDDGPKREVAKGVLEHGGVISVQVLNEVLVNCRRKAGMSWEDAGAFLDAVRDLCCVVSVTEEIHDLGRAVGERHQLGVYDAMIVAAALAHGCNPLYSEDMADGLVVADALRIQNPFRQA